MTEMIVTIDGPSGSGKSTAARTLATRLGLEYLDTGAMYRAVAWSLHRAKIDPADEAAVAQHLSHFHLEMHGNSVCINEEPIPDSELRSPENSLASSAAARFPHIRRFLISLQQQIAKGRRMICEGRDQGTVVFPKAQVKIFLTASPEARAERRWQELKQKGNPIGFEQVLANQIDRDTRDSSQNDGRLIPAENAIVLDTTGMPLEAVLDRISQEIQRCLHG
ncbi:(d)CMP kinase [Tuwongella immobilis]|uniref:Cytidylate kinase n=1 Tax=Tuwongella immobilis TaxID=692036 RepID=A0A6C2YSR0_9BACT|nr:(d)CMP kinase [Tuwongella immobilis]VIP04367.1 cytidylate kinase : Cytidylate kinase OS=Thermoactinomyces sp. Gus2-1 GN=cmk PE=3 SV=1: Cytidylate_kin [Tuwongella immobilis]VTS06096.1 cytidylate kinase : Cytidylate kinase OS=Thermoactinomyces sp. Gus2-1 GN=cmk PE=3 SV=1: Cytidylate_kin [Tuwongella immobilis]